MKPPVETIRISKQGKDQLSKLRKQTGIEHWNVLCRWAFCVSLKEKTTPPPVTQKLDGGVEMTWKVFAGENSELFSALIWMRAHQDGFALTPEGGATCLRIHLHRGLAYLASGKETKSLSDLIARWIRGEDDITTMD
jgi:DNA sulfur modification protein DndE